MAIHDFVLLLCVCLMTNSAKGTTDSIHTETSLTPPTTSTTPSLEHINTPETPVTMPATSHPTPTVVHNNNIHCYSCKYVSNLQNCRYAKRCPSGSSCLTGQLSSGLYYMDCIPTPACMVLPAQLQTSGTVTFLNNKFKHFQCCTQSKCNKNQVHGVGR